MGVIDNATLGEKLFILFFTPLILVLAIIATFGLWLEDRLRAKKIIGLFITLLTSLIFVKPTFAMPPVTVGLVANYDASILTGNDGDTIATWNDLSSSVNNLTSAGIVVLKTGANGINGHNVVRTNAGTHLSKQSPNNIPVGASPRSFFFVVRSRQDPTMSSNVVWGYGSANSGQLIDWYQYGDPLNNINIHWWGDARGSIPFVYNDIVLAEAIYAGAPSYDLNFYAKGVQKDYVAVALNTVMGAGLYVGTGSNNGYQGAGYDFGEFLIYNTALDTTDRQLVENYLINKWYTPAPTPTPTPPASPSGQLIPFTYAPPSPQWSADYWTYGHYIQATSTQWIDPVKILGTPDTRYATIANSVGYAPLFSIFDLTPIAPASWGNVTGLKFDIIGKNIGNVVIYPAYGVNGSVGGTPVCSGKQVSAGSTLNHNYVTFTNTECGGYFGIIKNAIENGDFGYKLTFYTGNAMTATIDSVAYLAVYDNSPYDITATNSARISPIAQVGIPLEVCEHNDILCNLRNWASGTLNYIFGIDQSFAANKFDALNTQMSEKIPFAYILALGNLDMGTAASSSAIPDFSMNYTSKYNGVEVFSTDILVQQDDLPDLSDIAGTLRTVITIILWVSVIWFLVKYWRHLF